jgi:hypothetical protein
VKKGKDKKKEDNLTDKLKTDSRQVKSKEKSGKICGVKIKRIVCGEWDVCTFSL